LVSKRLNPKPTQDHSQLISRGFLVLGVALVALLVIPFLTGTSSEKEFTGKVATATTTHENYYPKGYDDEYFEKLIHQLGQTKTFLKCKEQEGQLTFLYQNARVTGKNNVPLKVEMVYKNGCFGDNLVTYECDSSSYKSTAYGSGSSFPNEDVDLNECLGAQSRNKNLRSDPDKDMIPLVCSTPGPKQLTTICRNGCQNKKCN